MLGLQLAFDGPPPAFVSEGRLRVDRVANDVTYDRARLARVKAEYDPRTVFHSNRPIPPGGW